MLELTLRTPHQRTPFSGAPTPSTCTSAASAWGSQADIVIAPDAEAHLDEWRLGYEALRPINPGLVFTSITPFGDWGPPYAGFKASDLVLFHMSGNAHGLLGAVHEPDNDPPIRAGGHQAELVVGMAAATATLAALYRKRMTGLGCHVHISAFEAMVN